MIVSQMKNMQDYKFETCVKSVQLVPIGKRLFCYNSRSSSPSGSLGVGEHKCPRKAKCPSLNLYATKNLVTETFPSSKASQKHREFRLKLIKSRTPQVEVLI